LEIKRSVLVPYPMEEMFDLIEQAEHYPLFLPWCTGANILERSDEWVAARIDFKYLQVRFGFQTRNPKRGRSGCKVRMVEGPFRRFEADWLLSPLGSRAAASSLRLSLRGLRRPAGPRGRASRGSGVALDDGCLRQTRRSHLVPPAGTPQLALPPPPRLDPQWLRCSAAAAPQPRRYFGQRACLHARNGASRNAAAFVVPFEPPRTAMTPSRSRTA
jgi:ribosome-associated toxin RatA of RatAB toxin-antitoxin module